MPMLGISPWNVWSVLTAVWMLALSVRLLRFRKAIGFLRDVVVPAREEWPLVSVIVPACNEGSTIGAALRSLLDQDYPNLEIVLVDDRSTDATGVVMAAVAASDPRVRVVSVRELPAGWLGKTHALHCGVQAARGEWLLFSDADIHVGTHSLRKAIVDAERRELDFLAVTPSTLGRSHALRVAMAYFVHWGSLAIDVVRIGDPRYPDALGTGAFNLVRRPAYDRSAGFEWLRMEVIDDSGLAFMMKESGARTGVASGVGEVELEWYPSLGGFVRGLEKNGFALLQFSVPLLLFAYAGVLATLVGFTIAPVLADRVWIAPLVWASLVIYLLAAASSLRALTTASPAVVLWFPLALPLMPLVFVRSAIACLWRGGIEWRGTVYPLAALRAGQRLKLTNLIWRSRTGAR